MQLQSSGFIADEIKRLEANTKSGANEQSPYEPSDEYGEIVACEDYDLLLSLAAELAARVKDGRLK